MSTKDKRIYLEIEQELSDPNLNCSNSQDFAEHTQYTEIILLMNPYFWE